MERVKDIEFQGKKYQISKLPVADSMYIILNIIQKSMPAAIENQVISKEQSDVKKDILSKRPQMSRDEIKEIMDLCLKSVKCYTDVGPNSVPMPIIQQKRFNPLFKDLEYDIITCTALVVHTLIFNIQAFFDGKALDELIQSLSGLSLANILPSTPISGPQ